MCNQNQMNAPILLFVVNIPRFFVSHRLALALAAREAGYAVHVATSDADPASIARITATGLPFHPLPLSQHGINPFRELSTLLALTRLYRNLKPDLLHHVSIKPVIYGGIAAKLSGRHKVVQAMSGLGYVFISDDFKAKLLRIVSRPAFKLALAGAETRMVFQNSDDQNVFINHGLIAARHTRLIRGSGVDTDRFQPTTEPPTGKPIVLFAGRLLWQKGIGEFVAVARRLQGRAIFRVAGYEESSSPLNVPATQLAAWHDDGLIEWLGKRDDMPKVYAESNIVCLPSTYGEGVPKVLIEAASCARACVTTDTPGCREIVRRDQNGLLVPPGDIDALTLAVSTLIENPQLRQSMGDAGRQIVLDSFSLRQVVDETIALYRSLLDPPGVSSRISANHYET